MAGKKRTEGIESDGLEVKIAEGLKKDGANAFFIGMEETPTDLKDFISTGSSLLDLAISNRPNGGIAVGRITELAGMEQSGKSLICAHLIANVQKEGGTAVLIDTEAAVNEEFFQAVGVDMKKMIYATTETVEQIFEHVEKIIEVVRSNSTNSKKVLIVIDSIAAASTKTEMEGTYEKSGYGTDKAKIIGQALRKITPLIARQKIALVITNQLRFKMNVQAFQDPYTTPGGKAIPFHTSTRIRLSLAGAIKTKDKEQIGVKVSAKIIKNRLGPPNRVVQFDVYYDRGIDDISSWITYLKDKEIITGGAGGNWVFVSADGNSHKFTTATWKQFTTENSTLFEEIYTKMSDAMIMQYNSEGLSTADGTAEVDTDAGDTSDV